MNIKLYLIALPVFFAIDMLWLGVISKDFYKQQLGYIMTPNVNWYAAIIFYLIFIAGLVLFVISPALAKNSLQHALVFGALFGFITYATYDLTNLATIKDWPLKVTIIDMIWGAVLASSVSTVTYLVSNKIL
jgi:uncharacterized membrane protein